VDPKWSPPISSSWLPWVRISISCLPTHLWVTWHSLQVCSSLSHNFFLFDLVCFGGLEMCFVWFCLLDSSCNFFWLQHEGMPITTISLDCLDIWKWSFSYFCVQCIVVASTQWSLRMWGRALSNFARLFCKTFNLWWSSFVHWILNEWTFPSIDICRICSRHRRIENQHAIIQSLQNI
jgi:hypothetical protein